MSTLVSVKFDPPPHGGCPAPAALAAVEVGAFPRTVRVIMRTCIVIVIKLFRILVAVLAINVVAALPDRRIRHPSGRADTDSPQYLQAPASAERGGVPLFYYCPSAGHRFPGVRPACFQTVCFKEAGCFTAPASRSRSWLLIFPAFLLISRTTTGRTATSAPPWARRVSRVYLPSPRPMACIVP